MELVGGWYLIHRTPGQLLALAAEAGIAASNLRVGSEPNGVNLFMHVRRPEG
jgi:hypothetical protein